MGKLVCTVSFVSYSANEMQQNSTSGFPRIGEAPGDLKAAQNPSSNLANRVTASWQAFGSKNKQVLGPQSSK